MRGEFAWDKDADKDSRIFLVLVLADARQVGPGWKNYLHRKMLEECIRQKTDYKRIYPLILTDLGTLTFYRGNFKKFGFLQYFINYYKETNFVSSSIRKDNKIADIMNKMMSFSEYINNEEVLEHDDLMEELFVL